MPLIGRFAEGGALRSPGRVVRRRSVRRPLRVVPAPRRGALLCARGGVDVGGLDRQLLEGPSAARVDHPLAHGVRPLPLPLLPLAAFRPRARLLLIARAHRRSPEAVPCPVATSTASLAAPTAAEHPASLLFAPVQRLPEVGVAVADVTEADAAAAARRAGAVEVVVVRPAVRTRGRVAAAAAVVPVTAIRPAR